jgi:hypothetical protein
VYSTNPKGPDAKEPHLEFTTHSEVILPGSTLRGQVALFNTAHNRYVGIELALVAEERLYGKGGRLQQKVILHRYRLELPVQPPGEGEAIPFGMRCPDTLPPSWRTALWEVRWRLEVRARVRFGADAEAVAPLTVAPKGSERIKRRQAPPDIGARRVLAIWQQVADTLSMRLEDDELVAELPAPEAVEVRVARQHRGADGVFLVAQLRYRSLELHIDGGKTSGFRRIFQRDVPFGDTPWHRKHYLTGRDEQQIAAFGHAWLAARSGWPITGILLSDVSDDELWLELRDGGQSRANLERFARAALGLATQLRSARAAIPAPTSMQDAVPAWHQLAKVLGGELELARMAAAGRFQGTPAWVVTRWSPDGEAIDTRMALEGGELEVDAALEWSLRDGYQKGGPAQLPGRARAALGEAQKRAHELRIDQRTLMASLPAPQHDTRSIRSLLGDLAALAQALRPQTGPYR